MLNYKDLIVKKGVSFKDTVETIDRLTSGVALVVDEDDRLIGILTDGDIRRAILRNVDLNDSIEKIMHPKPITATRDFTRNQLLHLIKCKSISHLPIVDNENRVIDVVFTQDFIEEHSVPVRGLIMAGGFGSRLMPLTSDTPKPLLKVGHKPVLQVIVEQLRDLGISDIYISLWYKGDKIEEHFKDGSHLGVRIHYIKEEKKIGTAGALSLIREDFDEHLLVINGDVLTRVDFKRFINYHLENNAEITVGVKQHILEVPYGVIEVRNEDIVGLSEKPSFVYFINAGIYLLQPGVRRNIPYNQYFDMTELIKQLIREKRKVCSFPIREYWLDIGKHKDYERANIEYEKHFG